MKLAILCGGKPQLENEEPLQGIENSLSTVENVLGANGWRVVPSIITATTESNFTDRIKQYNQAESINIRNIKEIIFFYTGHGKYGDSYSQGDFKMVWQDQGITVSSIINQFNDVFLTQQNKIQIGLIIDACYSGDALIERTSDKTIEILTSTKSEEKTFEKNIDGRIISIFSHTFTKIFTIPNQNGNITIRDIKDYINDPANGIDDLKVYYSEALERSSITVGTNKEINEVKEVIRNHYSNMESIKKDFKTYLNIDSLSFPKVSECDDFDNLINYLFEDKECLYCILQDILPEHEYLEKLKQVNCEERREEDRLKKIVFLIGNDHSEDSDSKQYNIQSYLVTEKNRVRPTKSKKQVDFTNESVCEKIICDFIADIDNQLVSAEAVEIIFILPNNLHNIDFSRFKCNGEDLKSEYEILTQSYIRYLHVDKDSIHKYITRWKVNSTKYLQNKQNSIGNHLYSITDNEQCEDFGRRYIRRGATYVCLVSSVTLVSYVDKIISFGLPIVVFPWDGNHGMITQTFQIREIKYNLLEYISEHGNNHYFMYDLYDEVKELKQQISQNTTQLEEYI